VKEGHDVQAAQGGKTNSGPPTHESVVLAVISAVIRLKPGIDPATLDDNTLLWSFEEGAASTIELDSLDMLDLVLTLEEEVGLRLRDDAPIYNVRTVGEIASCLCLVDD
jgi:hypothetical protein